MCRHSHYIKPIDGFSTVTHGLVFEYTCGALRGHRVCSSVEPRIRTTETKFRQMQALARDEEECMVAGGQERWLEVGKISGGDHLLGTYSARHLSKGRACHQSSSQLHQTWGICLMQHDGMAAIERQLEDEANQ